MRSRSADLLTSIFPLLFISFMAPCVSFVPHVVGYIGSSLERTEEEHGTREVGRHRG